MVNLFLIIYLDPVVTQQNVHFADQKVDEISHSYNWFKTRECIKNCFRMLCFT